MSLSHSVNIVDLVIEKVNQIGLQLFSLEYDSLPILISVIDFHISDIAFEEAGPSMLINEILIDIGIYFQIIPSLREVLLFIVAMSQLASSLLIGHSIVRLERIKCTGNSPQHQGDY